MSMLRRGEYDKPLLVLKNGLTMLQIDLSQEGIKRIPGDMDILSGGFTAIQNLLETESLNLENINIINKVEGNSLILDKLADFVIMEDEGDIYTFITFSKNYHFNRNLKEAFEMIIEYGRDFMGDLTSVFNKVKEQYHLFRLLLREQEKKEKIPIKSVKTGEQETYEGFSQAIVQMMEEVFGEKEPHYIIGGKTSTGKKTYFYTSPFLDKFQELFNASNFEDLKNKMFEFYNYLPREAWPLMFVFYKIRNRYDYMISSSMFEIIKKFNEVIQEMPVNQRANPVEFEKRLLSEVIGSQPSPEITKQVIKALKELKQS